MWMSTNMYVKCSQSTSWETAGKQVPNDLIHYISVEVRYQKAHRPDASYGVQSYCQNKGEIYAQVVN